jgi:alcohol dehydrogenase (cytochrome c)
MHKLSCRTSALALLAGAVIAFSGAKADEVTFDRIVNAASEPHNWLTHHGTLDAMRFSRLDQINTENVKDLKVAWTMALGGIEGGGIWPHGGLEGTPIVENGFMYVTDGWGSVYKIDLRGGTGKLVWRMDPDTDKDWAGSVACCGVNNRGVALWGNYVVSHTLDGRLIKTHKDSGEVEWERQLADPAVAETITGAPLIVKDMAITGVGGAEYGIRGWIAATDLKTGDEVWRFHTIPEPGEPGSETWADEHGTAWKNGGGSTWVTGSYDPDKNLIYWGVGNPGPDWDNEYRPGDNLYTDSAVALDADTGELKWHFQYTPNDPYDYDSVAEHTIIKANIKGQEREAVLHSDRNGFAYALDANTGEFLWGTPFVERLTWTDGLDEKGRPNAYDPEKKIQTYLPGTAPSRENPLGRSCPGNMGGKNWPPTAYNPDHQLYYIPVIESCNEMTNEEMVPGESYKPREWFTGGGPRQFEPIYGSLTAIDVTTGEIAGKYKTTYPLLGGVLTTAGDLVFTGLPAGEIVALDSKTLKELWRFETGSGVNAPPMTYSVNGKQYVAILVGLGGAWPKWFVDGTKGLEKVQPSSMLYVFSL